MWWLASSTVMRSYGFSCLGKDSKVLILSALVELPYSWTSKITGYTAKDFFIAACYTYPRILRQILAEGEGGEGLLGRPLYILGWSSEVVGVWWVAPPGAG